MDFQQNNYTRLMMKSLLTPNKNSILHRNPLNVKNEVAMPVEIENLCKYSVKMLEINSPYALRRVYCNISVELFSIYLLCKYSLCLVRHDTLDLRLNKKFAIAFR